MILIFDILSRDGRGKGEKGQRIEGKDKRQKTKSKEMREKKEELRD